MKNNLLTIVTFDQPLYWIHRLPWKKGESYNAIAESYADLTVTHYGQARVVFDGYGECPSIKDEEMRKNPTPCC